MVELSYEERVRRRLQGETASSAVERARLEEQQERARLEEQQERARLEEQQEQQLDVREQQQRLDQLVVGGSWQAQQ